MNKTLIAAAVSAAVAAPVASADITVYGRVNNAIDLNDLSANADSESTTDISTVASRFGLKGSTDLGNGLTVHGQYEFSTSSDKETGPNDVRVASAGVSGSFGRLDVGNLWSAYNKTFGTLVSPTYTLGYYLYADVGGGLFRASNTIQYSNSWGPVGAVLDIRLNDADEGTDVAETVNGNGWGLGVNYQVTSNFSLVAAYDNEDGDTTTTTTTILPSLVALPAVTESLAKSTATTADERVAFEAARQQQMARRTAWRKQVDAISAHLGYDPVTGSTATAVTTEYTNRAAEIVALTATGRLPNGGDVASQVADLMLTQPIVPNALADADDADLNLALIDDEAAEAAEIAVTSVSETTADDTERTGIAARYSFGDYYVQGGLQSMEEGDKEVDTYFIYGGGPIGQKTTWLLGYAGADDGTDTTDDSNQLVWGLYHNVGGGLRLYYEAVSVENESKSLDGERHLLGIRVDF